MGKFELRIYSLALNCLDLFITSRWRVTRPDVLSSILVCATSITFEMQAKPDVLLIYFRGTSRSKKERFVWRSHPSNRVHPPARPSVNG